MRHLKALMLIVLTISVMLLALTSCETVENVVGQIPGIENILPHQHNFVEGKCECGEIDPEYVAPHVHEFVNGKCECGEVDPSFSCLNHVWSEPVLESEATCTKEGRYVITCTVCGYQRYTPIFELGHDDDEVTVEATCTEDGLLTKTCKRCGDVREEVIKAEGHEISKSVFEITTAPTCTEKGVVTYPCANCDYFETAELDALGHHFVDGECECGEKFVPAVIEGDWALVTELKTGDHILIGNPSNGKLFSSIKTGYYNVGINYSEEDFTNVTDAEIWVVTANDDGSYTFTSLSTGKPIAMAASYASFNEAGPNDDWSLVAKSGTNGIFYIKNTVRGNYIEWYAEKNNWSTFATSSLSALFEISFYAKSVVDDPDAEHVHNYISEDHAPTCTEAGYTSYTCRCGETYTEAGDAATGHAYAEKVVAPTCTEAGYTDHTCGNCGDNYKTDEVAATGHNHVETTVAPTCTTAGYSGKICACGDKQDYVEVPKLGHVDENLDVECDREGCTSKVAPPAESKLSVYTANCLGSKLSTTSQYYVEGVIVEVLDAKNGIFLLSDGTEETFYFRLPKNAAGTSYSSWTDVKVVVGDKVQIYGKINKYTTSSAPNGQYYPAIQGGLLTILEHTHNFSNPTCTEDGVCGCLAKGETALGHADTDKNGLCDRCEWNMNNALSNIVIATNPDLANGVVTNGDDGKALYWTWSDDEFDVVIHKGTSTYTLYTKSKAYMQLKQNNTLTVVSKNGVKIVSITIYASNDTQLTNLKNAIGTAYNFTEDAENLCVTIAWNSTEEFVLSNCNKTTAQVAGVEVIYEKPVTKAEPVTVVMANTITDTQTSYMTGGNDAALVGLDPSIFTVTGDKGNVANNVVLYYKSTLKVPSQIRLSSSTGTGQSITVSAADGYKITSIKITFTTTANHRGYVVTDADGTTLYSVATDATFDSVDAATAIVDVNGGSFTITNAFTVANKPVWIAAIEITYEEV